MSGLAWNKLLKLAVYLISMGSRAHYEHVRAILRRRGALKLHQLWRADQCFVALYGCRSGMGLIFPNQDVVAPLLTYVSDPCSLKPSLARFESFCEYARILATWRGSARGVASAHVDIGCVAQRSNPTMDRTMGSRIRFSPLSGLRDRSGFASSLSSLLPPLSSLLLPPPFSSLLS